ncbi:MAG: hypothetical protein K2H72_01370, partial [Muribaculaceae bacterium]|nr:hypothetical protein [Muribaculaceae bacterium]
MMPCGHHSIGGFASVSALRAVSATLGVAVWQVPAVGTTVPPWVVSDLSLCSFRVSDGAAGRKACSPCWTRRGVDRQASGHR